MEHFALYRTLREIDSLFKGAPKEATIIDDDGSEQRLSVTQIKNGQLLLSIPSAILAAIAWGAKNGILFRGGAAVEKLAQVDLIALDKTGRLTTGNLHVQKI
jgi:cation transport ATPase